MRAISSPLSVLPILLLVLPSGPRATDPVVADPEDRRIEAVERDLLTLVNRERLSSTRHVLSRDAGMDRLILWHVSAMADRAFLSHEDVFGRDVAERVLAYSSDTAIRCSEIIQWWSGPPNGKTHYEGYFRSPTHHDAYMERAKFRLGPESLTGVAAVSGPGPAGTRYAGIDGSYTGMLFCDRPLELARDPFGR